MWICQKALQWIGIALLYHWENLRDGAFFVCDPLKPMISTRLRIAILHHAFDPRLNYLESVFARTLHKLGHEVRVFTTTGPIVRGEQDWAKIDAGYEFPIERTKWFLRGRHTVVPLPSGMGKKIKEFNPQVAFLLAAHHGVGYFWMRYLSESCRVITGYSDLPWYPHSKTFWRLFKSKWLKAVLDRADMIWTTTPLTEAFLRSVDPSLNSAKIKFVGHSFDPDVFDAEPVGCDPAVAELCSRIPYVLSVITATNAMKNLDKLFDYIESFLLGRKDCGLIFAGFRTDAFSLELRERIGVSAVGDRCLTLPMMEASQMKAVFQRSKCSIWTQVSIGVHQSLASGCPVLLLKGEPLEHLLIEDKNAMIYASFKDLPAILEKAIEKNWDREVILKSIEPYRSDRQLQIGLEDVLK